MDLFVNLNTWRRGDKIAHHKPLLILYLLGQLHNYGKSEFEFSVIREEVNALFGSFGVTPKVEQPFWRLRNDKILHFPNESQIGIVGSGDPRMADLKRHGVAQLSEEFVQEVATNPEVLFVGVENLLAGYFPESWHDDLLSAVGLTNRAAIHTSNRKRNPRFRQEVATAYNHQCAVCGFNISINGRNTVNEAAHIKWHAYNGPDIVSNGMLLCPVHHKLFDRGIFTLTHHLKIEISNSISGIGSGLSRWLFEYEGKEILAPRKANMKPEINFLQWHQQEVFLG